MTGALFICFVNRLMLMMDEVIDQMWMDLGNGVFVCECNNVLVFMFEIVRGFKG